MKHGLSEQEALTKRAHQIQKWEKKLFLSTLELELYTCNAAYYHNYAIHRHSGHVLGLFVNVFDMMIMDLMLSFTI